MALTSLERLLDFASDEIPQEAAWETPGDAQLTTKGWPSSGQLRLEGVALRYRPELLTLALRDLDLEVRSGERVGVVVTEACSCSIRGF